MASPPRPERLEEFRFRRLDKPEEFRAVEEVQRAAWGVAEGAGVSAALQRAIQDNGGLILGAFVDIYLAGFSLGFLGWDGSKLFHYSHMTAVRPEYQNHRVGFRLKLFQREEVLKQGLSEIRWTFDPLQSRNAMINVRQLGGTPMRYHIHYYGQMDDELNRDMETDRLSLSWEISSPRVEARIGGALPGRTEEEARWRKSVPIVETEAGDSGIRIPVSVTEPSAPQTHLEIPFDLALVRQHEPESLRRWRHAVRDAFRAAFDLGYRVDDFAVVSPGHERRSFYFLSAPPGAQNPGAGADAG